MILGEYQENPIVNKDKAENKENAAVNWTVEECGSGNVLDHTHLKLKNMQSSGNMTSSGDYVFIYEPEKLKNVCVRESDTNQDKAAKYFTGEKPGCNDDSVYTCRKPKYVCVSESDSHQENSIVNLTGEKSSSDGDPDENKEKTAVNWTGEECGCGSVLDHTHLKLQHMQLSENMAGENSGGGYDPLYAREKLKNMESGTNQEKPAVYFTGACHGRGSDPVYKHGKQKKMYIDESDINVNQENPAVNLTGEKSDHENQEKCLVKLNGDKSGDVYSHRKLQKVCLTICVSPICTVGDYDSLSCHT